MKCRQFVAVFVLSFVLPFFSPSLRNHFASGASLDILGRLVAAGLEESKRILLSFRRMCGRGRRFSCPRRPESDVLES